MADIIYNSFKQDVVTGIIDLDTDSFKVMLLTSTYTPSAAHAKRSDLTNEVTGTGYTAGGAALASVTVTRSGGTVTFDAADTTWATATLTARYAVIYKSRGGLATADELVCLMDFVTDKSSSAGNFTIQYNASGILTLT
jgi:hypothetical protein